MANIRALLAKLQNWDDARDALEELAKLPAKTKRAEVYPHVVDLAVTWWCEKEGASDCGYEIENVSKWLVPELAVEPGLASAVYAGMGKGPKFREYHFYNFARAARDPGALPLLRGLWKKQHSYWGDAVLALEGTELADDALRAATEVANSSDVDLAVAAGFLGGKDAIDPLRKLVAKSYRKDGPALGLALAGYDDEAFFKGLSTAQEGATAKRLYLVFHKEKQKDRLAALDALGKNADPIKKNGTTIPFVSTGALLGLCKLLDDADPLIVERAADYLDRYAKARGEYQNNVYHRYFLERAAAAIARGVSKKARASLDEVQRSIPRSEPFGAGKVAPAPQLEVDARATAAEQRAREKLDAMGVAPGAKTPKAAKAAKTTKAKPEKKPFGAALGALASAPTELRDKLPLKAGTNRNPELDAQIAEDPTDRARYLVYGDWLQQQGDSRGALIALHDAADRGEKGAADAAALLLREHRYALLGLLDGVEEIELEWQLGFIRGARLKYPNQAKLLRGLETLLAAESARFLQSIVIDPLEDKKPADGKPILDELIEHAPKTLSHLQIGKPGKWTLPDEVRAAFPRLERDPSVAWDEVLAKIAEQKRLEIRYLDAKKLPKLEPRSGKPAVDPDQILLGLRAEIEKSKPIGIVAALPRVFTRDSVDAFALALVQQWMKHDDQAIVKFAFDATGPLGGDACAKFLGSNLTTWSHARAVQAIEHLRRIGSDCALYQIVRLVLLPGLQARRDAAETLLENVAKSRDCGFDDLLDEVAPPDNDLLGQRAWLSRLIVHGHRIAPAAFHKIAKHPVRGPLAATLVWATFTGKRDLGETFAVARDGSLRRADGSAFELDDSRVGLVHPIELPRDVLDTWRETFERRELEQAIPQLDRPTFRLSAADANTETLDGFAKRRAGFTLINDTLLARDWYVHEQYDAGGTESFARRFERGNITCVASFGTSMGAIATVRVQGKDQFDRRRFGSVDAVTVSELLYDLELAHGYREARGAAPARSAPAPAARGSAPIVERAKTGRAKCVVCEKAIAKGDPRVGVDRQIQTDTFTGRGTVWAHPACRDGMPELAGVDVDALVSAL